MKKALIIILGLDLLALFYGASTLSIGADEARVYFSENTPLYYLTHFFTFLFGQNDLALRLPFLILHFFSCIFLYILALKMTKTQKDALFSVLVFILLPGSVASALLVNHAALVIFFTLLILCAYEYEKKLIFYLLLVLSFFLDSSFAILYLALFFFGLYKKDALFWGINLLLFSFSLAFYGFDTSGKPQNYFLDTLGIFAACFSPLVFVYFFYVIYRLAHHKQKPILWFIIATSFVFCLLVSLRQKIYLEDFLPFCVISVPLLVKVLMASYRVRLPNLRLKYNIFIECSLIFLLFCYLLIIFNSFLYAFIQKANTHFAYNYHGAKELALKLNEMGIHSIKTNEALQIRLKFYGINTSDTLILEPSTQSQADFSVQMPFFKLYYKFAFIQ